MSIETHRADATEFHRVIGDRERPVLVDFYADWCGPCRSVAPVLEAAAETYEGELDIVKVDVDRHGDLASQYGVRSIPTLILFRDGEAVDQRLGALSSADLNSFIEQHGVSPARG